MIFAPQNSHSVMKDGRKCNDCHGIENVKKVQNGKIEMTWLEDGELKKAQGVIPVVDGVAYDCVYYNYRDGKWIPIKNPPKPLMQYVAYGNPLSESLCSLCGKKFHNIPSCILFSRRNKLCLGRTPYKVLVF
jgi:hypothetical protein